MHNGSTMSSPHKSLSPWPVDRERVLTQYLALLAEADSPLLRAGPQVMGQVQSQLYGVIDAVAVHIDATNDGPDIGSVYGSGLSETIGRSRATAGIHPSQSLQAAALIFEAALPTIAARLAAVGDRSPEVSAALLLNREVLQRMASAARAYVEYLLDKAHSSNADERRRLSRELHDVAAPTVAIGLQNLELFDLYRDDDPDRAAGKLQAARQSMLDALATIRGLSAQSRDGVGASGLDTAIRRYLDTMPTDIDTTVDIDGDPSSMSLAYAEELFLIIREAVRNAVDHAHPQTITIRITVKPGELRAEVRDDGRGFTIDGLPAAGRHVGLDSMHERADLLGAHLTITSTPRRGTTVTVTISLPSQHAPAVGQPR